MVDNFKKEIKNEIIFSFQNEPKQKRKRHFGIDLGRIVSMFFLINHHVLYHGGPIFGTKILSFDNNLY